MRQRVENARRGLRRNRLAHDVFNNRSAAEQLPVALVNLRERGDNRIDGRMCQRQRPREGLNRVLGANPAEHLGDGASQHRVVQQGRQPRRGDRIANPRKGLDRREREKEVARSSDRDQPIGRRRVPVAADRFDRVKPHVDVRIVERRDQRLDSLGTTLRAKCQCRLSAKIGVVISHQGHERVGDVDASQRQQLQARCSAR